MHATPPGKYGWMVMDVDGKAYRLNSGLFVASRYPLEAPEFVRYHVCTNEDVLAGKGVLACTVVVGETSTGQKIKITIFTTHAQVRRFTGPPLFLISLPLTSVAGRATTTSGSRARHSVRNGDALHRPLQQKTHWPRRTL
jgi:hypothetical protein